MTASLSLGNPTIPAYGIRLTAKATTALSRRRDDRGLSRQYGHVLTDRLRKGRCEAGRLCRAWWLAGGKERAKSESTSRLRFRWLKGWVCHSSRQQEGVQVWRERQWIQSTYAASVSSHVAPRLELFGKQLSSYSVFCRFPPGSTL